jgi:hypothetical protein
MYMCDTSLTGKLNPFLLHKYGARDAFALMFSVTVSDR